MSHHDRHPDAFTGQAAAAGARAACSQTGGEDRLGASRPGAGTGERPGLGGLWLLLVPLACRGGPLLIAALAAAGALAWAALGTGAGVLAAVTVLAIRRRRRGSRACCTPGRTGWAQEAPDAGYPAATGAVNTTNATLPRWRRPPAPARPYERRAARSRLSLRTGGAAGSCGKRKRERCLSTKSARAAGPGERHRRDCSG